ncbi:hypothetical protein DW825_07965 [Bifidobacterium adolescentis]|nr:hypothetical protein DWX12_05460 [Bifidobacterium pseudocatenulatum]RHC84687.1 hypothetical protein DW825_07965 [Bifidobacterium adolescentis]
MAHILKKPRLLILKHLRQRLRDFAQIFGQILLLAMRSVQQQFDICHRNLLLIQSRFRHHSC